MTAFSEALRAEVARTVRKSSKGELDALRKAVASQRREISALKKEVKALHSSMKQLARAVPSRPERPAAPVNRGGRKFVFRPEALLAKREAFGLTQVDMAKLVGASPLTLSRWEQGKAAPRTAQVEKIRAVLGMGVRAARAKLGDGDSQSAEQR